MKYTYTSNSQLTIKNIDGVYCTIFENGTAEDNVPLKNLISKELLIRMMSESGMSVEQAINTFIRKVSQKNHLQYICVEGAYTATEMHTNESHRRTFSISSFTAQGLNISHNISSKMATHAPWYM